MCAYKYMYFLYFSLLKIKTESSKGEHWRKQHKSQHTLFWTLILQININIYFRAENFRFN